MTLETPSGRRLELTRRLLMGGGVAVILIIAAAWYLGGGSVVSTDDAYVQAARVEVSANISGRVMEVSVRDNQHVHVGDALFRLDDREYRIALEDARARLASARLRVAELKASFQKSRADAQGARDTLAYLNGELNRQQVLASQGISSQAQLEQARHAAGSARQALDAAEQETAKVRATLSDDPGIAPDRHPLVQQALAEVERAELNLSYTLVRATIDGIVSKVESLQAGQYIRAATPVFALTSDKNVWIEANFKETDLTHMHAGQAATVEIDSYPGKTLRGHLESLSSGTGSSFSLLPPENATGNWVKVVQRVPVRIKLDDADAHLALQAGLSVTVDVETGHRRLKDYF